MKNTAWDLRSWAKCREHGPCTQISVFQFSYISVMDKSIQIPTLLLHKAGKTVGWIEI